MDTPRSRLPLALPVAVGLMAGASHAVFAQHVQEAARAPDAVVVVEGYRIGPEDVLDIAVWNNAEISRVVPVRPDGKISLPLLDDVHAAGLTPVELRDALRDKLVEYMSAPQVSVVVREVHSFKISVLGAVKTPGRYELKSRTTVLDGIALAGGFGDFASRGRIIILRQVGPTVRRIPFNYSKFVAGDSNEAELLLQPGDTIVVP